MIWFISFLVVAASSARDMRSVTRVVKPKHKPMTYVEQLQKLNEGTHKPRSKFSSMNSKSPKCSDTQNIAVITLDPLHEKTGLRGF